MKNMHVLFRLQNCWPTAYIWFQHAKNILCGCSVEWSCSMCAVWMDKTICIVVVLQESNLYM